MHTYPYETPVGFHERHVVENKDRDTPTLPFYLDQWDKALWVRGLRKPSRVTYRQRDDYRERLGAFTWDLPEEMHADNFVGNLACHWLDSYPMTDEPFFLQVGFPGPHPPYDPPPRNLAAYRDRPMPPAHHTPEDLASQPAPLQAMRREHLTHDHDAVVHLAEPTEEQLQRQRRHYYANVSLIDEQVGRLVDALERRGVLENTVIIVTSDHGDTLGDHGHSQKWTMYEPSVHVPAIIWGPAHVEASGPRDGLMSLMDIAPTVLELAGLIPPEWMEGESLLPALRGHTWHGREMVFSEHARDSILAGTALMTMVRDRRFKLVDFVDLDDGQLFDLDTDPHEERNLWHAEDHREVRLRLEAAISRWRAESAMHTATWAKDFR